MLSQTVDEDVLAYPVSQAMTGRLATDSYGAATGSLNLPQVSDGRETPHDDGQRNERR